jgi:hypothetical protein
MMVDFHTGSLTLAISGKLWLFLRTLLPATNKRLQRAIQQVYRVYFEGVFIKIYYRKF